MCVHNTGRLQGRDGEEGEERGRILVSLAYDSRQGRLVVGVVRGAHLAAMVLSTDWSQYNITPQINGECLEIGEGLH